MEDKGIWVRFNEAGEASWFGPERVKGSQLVFGVTPETLIACRLVDGEWLPRVPAAPEPEPEPEAPRGWLAKVFGPR